MLLASFQYSPSSSQISLGSEVLQLANVGILNSKGTSSLGSQPSELNRMCTTRPLGASTPIPWHCTLVEVASTITPSKTTEELQYACSQHVAVIIPTRPSDEKHPATPVHNAPAANPPGGMMKSSVQPKIAN